MSVNPKNPKNPENPENPEFKNSCKKSLDSESSFTEDDSVRINLKRIKEITTLRRKLSFKIPDIRTLNLDTRNSSTQTTADEDVVKVISQFRIEKETFQDLFEKEKENNIELREKLEEFKDKTTQLSSFIKEIEEKLKNSIDSETIHVKQSQELSNKCVQYSNQLISVNKRINELNQELKKSENILNNYTESLKLFHSDTGDLKEMILSEREEKDSEIKMLNERISNMIQLYQMESSFTPNLKIEDKMVIQKLEEKITNLQQEAEKEKSISLSNLDENQNLKLELENLKKKSLSDKRELKKLVEKIDVNKEDIASYQAKVSELQGFIVKKEQELYLQDQKFKNLQ
jgi:regulator of replication initiation timing